MVRSRAWIWDFSSTLSTIAFWQLELSDPLEVADSCLAPMLDRLAAVAAVWSLPIAPTEVRTPTGTLLRADAGYQSGPCDGATDPRAVARIGDRRRGGAVGLKLQATSGWARDSPVYVRT